MVDICEVAITPPEAAAAATATAVSSNSAVPMTVSERGKAAIGCGPFSCRAGQVVKVVLVALVELQWLPLVWLMLTPSRSASS